MDATLLAPHVDSHPDKCGGKPCVAGTRVRVWDVAHHIERLGETPDEVIQAYPHLSLADVYGAMAYYWDHREEIEQRIRQDHEEVEAMMREAGVLTTKVLTTKSKVGTVPSRVVEASSTSEASS